MKNGDIAQFQLVCDGQTDGRTDGRTDLQMDGWTDGRTNPFIEMLGASKNHDAIFTRFVESTWFHVFLLLLRYQPAPQYP